MTTLRETRCDGKCRFFIDGKRVSRDQYDIKWLEACAQTGYEQYMKQRVVTYEQSRNEEWRV